VSRGAPSRAGGTRSLDRPDDPPRAAAALAALAPFDPPISCSNLVRPDFSAFLDHLRPGFEAGIFSNAGPAVTELERRLARFHETDRCVSFASGFWALVLAMRALAVAGRREVVMPSLTYRRMADVTAWAGLVPRYCDVERDTLALSAATVAPCLSDATALVLAVHPIVNCCPADELEELAAAAGLPLLIDGVESCYERYHGRKVGAFGHAEVFSLHASKLINGFEGGYVTTNDAGLADRLVELRGAGPAGRVDAAVLGINAHLPEVHAAMALASLEDLDDQVARNAARYDTYARGLASFDGLRLVEFDRAEPCSFKNIVVEVTAAWPLSREETLQILNDKGVLARAYYAPALHHKRASYPVEFGPLPVTDDLEGRFMLLPSGARLNRGDIERLLELLGVLAGLARPARSPR
jgi:dTDP-4-amino-4,6-dideoxygalactose transaminase